MMSVARRESQSLSASFLHDSNFIIDRLKFVTEYVRDHVKRATNKRLGNIIIKRDCAHSLYASGEAVFPKSIFHCLYSVPKPNTSFGFRNSSCCAVYSFPSLAIIGFSKNSAFQIQVYYSVKKPNHMINIIWNLMRKHLNDEVRVFILWGKFYPAVYSN